MKNEQQHRVWKEARQLTLLSIPIVATQLGQICNGFVDVVMVGRLGPAALAGVALGNATYFLFALIGIGVLLAVGPMVSQAYGAGEHDPIGRTVRQALWLALTISIPVLLILWNASLPWDLMKQDAATMVLAEGYLQAAMWGFIPFMWFNALRNFVEAIARPLPITIIIVMGILLNILANYGLMYGNFGLPRLGLVGTGWATCIVHWFMFICITAFVLTQQPYKSYEIFNRLRHPDLSYFRELLRVGLPIGGSIGLEVTLFSATAFLVGTFGSGADRGPSDSDPVCGHCLHDAFGHWSCNLGSSGPKYRSRGSSGCCARWIYGYWTILDRDVRDCAAVFACSKYRGQHLLGYG